MNKNHQLYISYVIVLIVSVLSLNLATTPSYADDPAYLRIGGGYYDVNRKINTAVEGHIEYLHNETFFYVKPFGGILANSDADIDVYAGIQLDLKLTDNIVLSPSFAPGIWARGSGQDLGYFLEFRSNIELGYQFEDDSRLSVGLYHLSNAGLGNKNPGTEVVHLTYSLPLEKLTSAEKSATVLGFLGDTLFGE